MPRIGEWLAQETARTEILRRAETEMTFIDRYRIQPLFFQDRDYPARLRNCPDSPLMLYYRGSTTLNPTRVVGVVGTRKPTDYGRTGTHDLVAGLAPYGVMVVSGLAYGIDGYAHRAALDCGIDTVGVLGHGLDTVYPWLHRPLAERMLMNGGLLTEFLSRTRPDRNNFPKRNRVIAGMCDAIVVVEAGSRGGALITADLANSYNRDVFAIPGRVTDACSEGTNTLIRTNRAALVQKPADIAWMMGWEGTSGQQAAQRRIFLEMTPEEERIVALLAEKGRVGIDDLSIATALPMGRVSASLLNLEFEGVVTCLPGKVYRLA